MTKEIPLTKGAVALVDDDMYDYLAQWSWCFSSNGYAKRRTELNGKQKTIFMHREVMQTSENMQVDHINGERLDNRKENLRYCTTAQNGRNRGLQRNNKSGFKGVSWRKVSPIGWQAMIQFEGSSINLGVYKTPEEAARAYDNKAKELFGEFARTNFT